MIARVGRLLALLTALGAAQLGCARTSIPVSPSPAAEPVVTRDVSSRIDSLMRDAMAEGHVAAVSLAIARGGRVIYAKGYGYRDLARRLPATPETIYNIASKQQAVYGRLRPAAAGRRQTQYR